MEGVGGEEREAGVRDGKKRRMRVGEEEEDEGGRGRGG